MTSRKTICWLPLGIFAVLFLCGLSCSQTERPDFSELQSSEIQSRPKRSSITVSAAASTKNVMEEIVKGFQVVSGVEVKLNTSGSSTLANQIIAGAPVDLFLSASKQWADEVDASGLVSKRERLLTNRLVLVVPPSNPAKISTPQDLLKIDVKRLALAGVNVPAGIYATQALTSLGLIERLIEGKKIVRGQDVRTALSYVERAEVEAAIVYSTDVAIAPGVQEVYQFDPSLHDEIVYVLVQLKASESNSVTNEFWNYLRTPNAMATYDRFGFDLLKIDDRSEAH